MKCLCVWSEASWRRQTVVYFIETLRIVNADLFKSHNAPLHTCSALDWNDPALFSRRCALSSCLVVFIFFLGLSLPSVFRLFMSHLTILMSEPAENWTLGNFSSYFKGHLMVLTRNLLDFFSLWLADLLAEVFHFSFQSILSQTGTFVFDTNC